MGVYPDRPRIVTSENTIYCSTPIADTPLTAYFLRETRYLLFDIGAMLLKVQEIMEGEQR